MVHSFFVGLNASLRNKLLINLGSIVARKFFQFFRSHAKLIEEELVIKLFQFLNQNMKFTFRVSFHKYLLHPKFFLLMILFLGLKFKGSNSQSISFLAKLFAITLQVTKALLGNWNFSCSYKSFCDPRKIFSCLRNVIFPVDETMSYMEISLKGNVSLDNFLDFPDVTN